MLYAGFELIALLTTEAGMKLLSPVIQSTLSLHERYYSAPTVTYWPACIYNFV
jgi:hypothetical protein